MRWSARALRAPTGRTASSSTRMASLMIRALPTNFSTARRISLGALLHWGENHKAIGEQSSGFGRRHKAVKRFGVGDNMHISVLVSIDFSRNLVCPYGCGSGLFIHWVEPDPAA